MKVTELKQPLKEDQIFINIIKSSINTKSAEDHNIDLNLLPSPPLSNFQETLQCQNNSLDHNYTKAKRYLSTIRDPLWKNVCQDVMRIMGAASFLEIWDSILGETYSQNKSIDIYCPTEKAAQFIKQYSFVILESLKAYFPALKQIHVKEISF